MTRRSTFYKHRAKVFTGKRNSGGKSVVKPKSSISVDEGRDLGLVQISPPKPTPKESTSRKKVSSNFDSYDQFKGGCAFDSGDNDIVDFGKFEMLLAEIAVCTKCKGSLSVSTSNRQGLSVNVNIRCNNNCKYSVSD